MTRQCRTRTRTNPFMDDGRKKIFSLFRELGDKAVQDTYLLLRVTCHRLLCMCILASSCWSTKVSRDVFKLPVNSSSRVSSTPARPRKCKRQPELWKKT